MPSLPSFRFWKGKPWWEGEAEVDWEVKTALDEAPLFFAVISLEEGGLSGNRPSGSYQKLMSPQFGLQWFTRGRAESIFSDKIPKAG